MKKAFAIVLYSLTVASLVTRCSPKAQTAEQILEDSVRRENIMSAIAGDSRMMTEMMRHIMQNQNARQMMSGNREMMMQMMGNRPMMMQMMQRDTSMSRHVMGDMLRMMETDTAACANMMSMMMSNRHMMSAMKDMMHRKGLNQGGARSARGMHMQMHGQPKSN